jgi:hypothetical protein
VARLNWQHVLDLARPIVEAYDTRVTLRQVFYRLVSLGVIPNNRSAYKKLSHLSSVARRDGSFPDLLDQTRQIHQAYAYQSPQQAVEELRDEYRLDRMAGQSETVCIGVEKSTLLEQLDDWFGDYGVPILALRGYSSQTYVDEVRRHIASYRRPAVLLYAGDFDPSGEDIGRDFVERTGRWAHVVRVALSRDQVEEYGLPIEMGKASDPRAPQFMARHGGLWQVELEALPPETLRQEFQNGIGVFWDDDAYRHVLQQETADRTRLGELLGTLGD